VSGLTHRIDEEREGLRAYYENAREHPNLYRVVRQAEFVDEECYRRYYDRFAKGYVRGLTQAMEAGQIRRMDPEALAYCLMGIGDFLGMRWVIWEGDPGLERVLDAAMALIQHGLDLRPPPRAGKASAKASTASPKRGARSARGTLRSVE
jgi:AcrR family transcriptional regulator